MICTRQLYYNCDHDGEFLFRACFENISGGLAAGRRGWLRCSSVTEFFRICALVKSEQIRSARLRGPVRTDKNCPASRAASPSAPPRSQSHPDLFSKHALSEKAGDKIPVNIEWFFGPARIISFDDLIKHRGGLRLT